jgi:hypothetical protein
LEKQHPLLSDSAVVRMLEFEEFYRSLRETKVTEQERKAIDEFISIALTDSCWKDFQQNCVENQLEPYLEIRELIFGYYAKGLKKKGLQESMTD